MNCPITTAENNAARRIEKRTDAYVAARTLLCNEFVNAMKHPGAAKVSTPAWGEKRASSLLVDVVSDSFASRDGDASLAELLDICSAAAKRGDARAKAWIETRAKEHAEWHADDLAADWGGK